MRRPEFIARQSRRPSGWLGEIVARVMARETVDANRAALDLLQLKAPDQVLEIGFGHGATLQAAAQIVTDGFLAGLDHSAVMHRIAGRRNAPFLRSGRMELKLADSARIPYPNARFSKIYAVHTIYFWEKPETHLGEIFRVMSPGGRLVLGYHPSEDARFARAFPRSIYTVRAIKEIEAATGVCGFQSVRTETKAAAQGLMAWTIAQKPGRP
ncbi:MAG TPA: class I SAM-dependent methyltransferase [Stellaceae bacterium]|nr:class I SAM-dependent methyltransferase [Stellaceae bacterium]